MKFACILIFCATTAFAAKPKVGDTATSLRTYKHYVGSKLLESSEDQSSMSVLRIDESADEIVVRFSDTTGHYFDMSYPLAVLTKTLFFESNEEICANFAAKGFPTALEQIQVAAGTYHTCKYTTMTDSHPGSQIVTTWLSSEVPFALVKSHSIKEESGNTFISDAELISIKN